jgi:prepilin-type processing-associated H-X9-DG protein
MPASRYLKALRIVLWIEAIWFLLSIAGMLMLPTLVGVGRTGGPPGQTILSIVLSLALAGLSAGGAVSIGRGGLWKGSVITLTILYGLMILILFALGMQVRPSKSMTVPPIVGVSLLAAAIGLLIVGMFWCWAKGASAWRAGRLESGPPPAVAALGFSLPSKVMVVAVPLMLLSGARAERDALLCQSNLRQLGMAVQIYANEYKGYIPPTFKAGSDAPLRPYVELSEIESCPAPADDHQPHRYTYLVDYVRAKIDAQGGAVPTPGLTSGLRTIRISRVRDVGATPLLWDDTPRHDGKRAVSFMDGHVELVPEESMQPMIDQAVQQVWQSMGGR